MPAWHRPLTFADVQALGLKLPGAEASTAYGSPALKVNGNLFACIAIHRSAEPDTVAVRVPLDSRPDLLTEAPAIYYLTDHYAGHPFVLVRLARVGVDALEGLLRAAHHLASQERRKSGQSRPKRRARRG